MQEIAEACRMSAANLYRFYPGKLAIASAVVIADQQALLADCDAAVQAAGPEAAEGLVALFGANIEAHRRRIRQAPLLFDLGLKVSREDRTVRGRFLESIEERILRILVSGRDCRAADFDAARTQARLILLACAPFVLPWMMLNEPFGDPSEQVAPLLHALVAGLRRPAELPRFS
jgi:AcrR family transcriptional regulator